MGHDTVKFFFFGPSVFLSIGAHPIDGNEEVTVDLVSYHVVERDDIGELILVEVCFMDFLEGSVGTEDDVQLPGEEAVRTDEPFELFGTRSLIEQVFRE